VLALSARFRRGFNASRDAAAHLGAGQVLPKPFTRRELIFAVEQATARER
jgi:hypothetical protein